MKTLKQLMSEGKQLDPPAVLIMKRKSVRQFPNGQRVALYYVDKIDKYVSMFFIDNIMPNITGELLSKILRGIGYSGLIIGVTGNGVEEDKTAFIESGADYVFVKPFTKEKLNKILEFVKNNGYESRYDDEEIIIEKENKLVWQKRG